MIDLNLQFFGGRGASSGVSARGGGGFKTDAEAERFFYAEPPVGGMVGEWMRDTNGSEKNVVGDYTREFYTSINKYLRSGEDDGFGKDMGEMIKKSLAKTNLRGDITVYRKANGELLGGAKTLNDVRAMAGALVQDKGVMSTTVVKNTLANIGGKASFQYEIKIPKGKGRGLFAKHMSDYPEENEFMVTPGTKFKVMGGYMDGKTVVCQLEAVYK